MAKITKKSAISGIVVLAVLAFVGYGVMKALERPGPRQKSEREKTQDALEIIKEWESKAKALNERLQQLAKFELPADGVIPRERMSSYVAIHDYVQKVAGHLRSRRPKRFPDLGGALFIARKEMAVLNKVRREKLLEYNMTADEYLWIRGEIRNATALAIKRLAEQCYGADKPEHVIKHLKTAAKNAGIYDKTEDGSLIPRPDKIDPSVIPETHYKYVLEYWPWLHPRRINKSELNMECLIEKESIKPAPFTPLEVDEYPDI